MASEKAVEWLVPPDAAGQTIREFLADALPLDPVSFARHVLGRGRVFVNEEKAGPRARVEKGAVVRVEALESERASFRVANIAPDILYEDEHILALNKPSGCTVVPRRNRRDCPFQNGIVAYLRQSPEALAAATRSRYRPRAVHRLDQCTSGVVIEAKTRAGELRVARQFQERAVVKEYLAVVLGEMADDEGRIEAPIGPVRGDLARMRVDEKRGRPSLTTCAVEERFRGFTFVRAFPETGRRHQIRVHLAHAGHPVVADSVYGGGPSLMLSSVKRSYRLARGRTEKPLIERAALHASAITFLPVGDETALRIEAPLPDDMALLLKMLRKYASGGMQMADPCHSP